MNIIRRRRTSRAARRPRTLDLLERRGQVCDAGCYAESRRERDVLRARLGGSLW